MYTTSKSSVISDICNVLQGRNHVIFSFVLPVTAKREYTEKMLLN